MSSYESLRSLVGTGGLIYFGVIFIVVLIYALAPKNRKKFDDAARMPLRED